MKSKNPYYNSTYFKNKPFHVRLKIRVSRVWLKIYCFLDATIIGKFKYGLKYNGQPEGEKEFE